MLGCPRTVGPGSRSQPPRSLPERLPSRTTKRLTAGAGRGLDFGPDPGIVVPGADEIALMDAERRRSGKFAG